MRRELATLIAALALPALAEARARVVIVNGDAAGVGFNDPTPAAPVGGNAGTTVGEQRLIAFQRAADIWTHEIESKVDVFVLGSFAPLSCTATSGVLGSAGTLTVWANFPRAGYLDTWYHAALANRLAHEDLDPADPAAGYGGFDIRARFNGNLGQPTCLAGTSWYYGLDTGHAPSQINLLTVLLHEFAHGLGFASFASVSTGAYFLGMSDIYSKYYYDLTLGKFRDQMTDAERKASAVNPRNVIWAGKEVRDKLHDVLARGTPFLVVSFPSTIAGRYLVGPASFGPAIDAVGVAGTVVLGDSGGNSLGCTPLTNGAAVAGNIALLDRGTCTFVVKVKNAQDAGAAAVLIADNVPGSPPSGLGGVDPAVVIPSVRITQADGAALKSELANNVTARLALDLRVRAGADPGGRALLYTPNPVQPGSTVSHWDTIATPNQLMEPAINADLPISVDAPQDLTRSLLVDIGWDGEESRPARP